jgi:transposase
MLEVSRSMRVEILANGKQRRRWSVEDRARIVSETSAAGAKVSVVARKHGLAPGQIFAWRREARAKELGASAAPGLVPVHVAAPGPTATSQQPAPEEPPRLARPAAKKKGLIEIDFGCGRRVRVDADVDAAALAVVLDVLERR